MADAKTPADAPPPPVVLAAGQVVAGHEIIKPLGKGKFSIVYMAKRLSDGLFCALKKINIFDMLQPKQREKCLKEVRILQTLDHPNIVKLLEAIVEQNELLIIVDWAEKGDLKRLIRKAQANEARFKEPQIWEYSRQLAGALDHMHGKRVMHRDIKPANIFVASDNSLKLGDLGLGRSMSCETLEAFSKVGTPLYMSPEVLHGAGYDMKSDVWSLGCVMYELVMLRSPFKSEQQISLYDLFVKISKGDFPPLPDTCGEDFRTLVNRTLLLKAADRPDAAAVHQISTDQVRHLRALRAEGKTSSRHHGDKGSSDHHHNGSTSSRNINHHNANTSNAHGLNNGNTAVAGADIDGKAVQDSPNSPEREDAVLAVQGTLAAEVPGTETARSSSRPSPLLVMDDVVEKLKLLDCEELLLRPRGYPLLHRCFFTQALKLPGELTQFEVFYELARWLLSLAKLRKDNTGVGDMPGVASIPAADVGAGPVAPVPVPPRIPKGSATGDGDVAAGGRYSSSTGTTGKAPIASGGSAYRAPRIMIEEAPELTAHLAEELHERGLPFTFPSAIDQMRQGWGETVCHILNELINQELVDRNFHFHLPTWHCPQSEELEEIEEDEDLECRSEGSQANCSDDEDDGAGGIRETEEASHVALEPVHIAPVDVEAWRSEVQSVAPRLKVMIRSCDSFGGWRGTLKTTTDLARKAAASASNPPKEPFSRSLQSLSVSLQEDLRKVRDWEDQINAKLAPRREEISQVTASAAAALESLPRLQNSTTDLTKELRRVEEELESAREEVAQSSAAAQDQEKVLQLRQAIRRLQQDCRSLSLRSGAVQQQLSASSLIRLRPSEDRDRDAGRGGGGGGEGYRDQAALSGESPDD